MGGITPPSSQDRRGVRCAGYGGGKGSPGGEGGSMALGEQRRLLLGCSQCMWAFTHEHDLVDKHGYMHTVGVTKLTTRLRSKEGHHYQVVCSQPAWNKM